MGPHLLDKVNSRGRRIHTCWERPACSARPRRFGERGTGELAATLVPLGDLLAFGRPHGELCRPRRRLLARRRGTLGPGAVLSPTSTKRNRPSSSSARARYRIHAAGVRESVVWD
ncbi:hypothetical protein [Phytohabitans houttuyneae]|uniref:hypothetical protein n=1 Tax=Phytohabitans houttuyneae TaxID=1076126 RepID=UPI001566D024|nr:hypothetical protein [Phytohabitans houttuyneae]